MSTTADKRELAEWELDNAREGGLWIKAQADTGSDGVKARERYVELRVRRLIEAERAEADENRHWTLRVLRWVAWRVFLLTCGFLLYKIFFR